MNVIYLRGKLLPSALDARRDELPIIISMDIVWGFRTMVKEIKKLVKRREHLVTMDS